MSLYQNPEELAEELNRWLRKKTELSPDTRARLEAAATREVRWHRRLWQAILFVVVIVPTASAVIIVGCWWFFLGRLS